MCVDEQGWGDLCGLELMTPVTEKKLLMLFCFPAGLPEADADGIRCEREDSKSDINFMTSYQRLVSKNGLVRTLTRQNNNYIFSCRCCLVFLSCLSVIFSRGFAADYHTSVAW